jgi:hypothetical protein
MKTNRKLIKAMGVLLIVMFAPDAQATPIVLKYTDFKQTDFVGTSHSGSKTSTYLIDLDILTPGTPKPAENDSDSRPFQFLDLDLFRLRGTEEPIPVPAILILVGLIALIALRGRRR